MEDLCFWIAFTCNSQMRLLASGIEKRQMRTLYDWFNPEILALDLEAIVGALHVQSSTPGQELLRGMTSRVSLPQSIGG